MRIETGDQSCPMGPGAVCVGKTKSGGPGLRQVLAAATGSWGRCTKLPAPGIR